MLQAAQKITSFENDHAISDCDFMDFVCKEEILEEEVKEEKGEIQKGFSKTNVRPNNENKIDYFPTWRNSVPECVKIKAVKPENNNDSFECIYLEPEEAEKIMLLFEDACVDKNLEHRAERMKQTHSIYPSDHQGFSLSLNFNSHSTLCSIVQKILKERRQRKNVKKNVAFHSNQDEAERIILKRKQDRERKARQRAQETEEQRNLRREKERLAKAARRAAEPLEKRLKRREKDRIAKALSRAQETEEQRKKRLEKNRRATAIGRATLSEEEKFIRRETDRIKKANIRAFETEEQKRIRRERNRLSNAIRRANLNKEKRKSLKINNSVTKTRLETNMMKPSVGSLKL